MIRMHDIDFEVDYWYDIERNESGEFKVLNIAKVYLNGFDVTPAFSGELLEHLIERIEAL